MRDPDVPLKAVGAAATGLPIAASRVHFVVLYEGAQRVFMDERRRVYACPVGTVAAERIEQQHPEWMVGTYSTWEHSTRLPNALRRVIIADLRARLDELRGARA